MHLSRRGLLYGTAGVAAVSLAACGAGEDSKQLTGFTGIAMPTTTSDRWVLEGADLEKRLQDLGYKTILENGEDDIPTQVAQIESMIEQGVEFLIIGAIGNTSLGEVLSKAKDKGVTIIAYDRLILETPDVDYYASFDNYQVGVLQAKHIITKLGLTQDTTEQYNVELFSGSLDDNNSQYFFQGGLDTLEPYIYGGSVVVPSNQTEQEATATQQWDRKTARTRMAQLLEDHYQDRPLHAVLSPYDGISRGIVEALVDADFEPGSDDFPVITGQDAELRSLKAIKEGTGQTETVFKDTRQLAEVAVEMVKTIVGGSTPDVNDLGTYDNGFKFIPSYLLEPVDVTVENYKEVVVDSAYATEEAIDNAPEDEG
ncbi:sugar-binding protein [Glycomyces algeriensis]|uniref:Sugar ABC transporter substrate-binding protein n=1 Tax=Glycomyces algeriensis TaxID=256037 RepID=A0A9W6G8H3_9ACTN|nr:sugar-binding protein [Glycomyces algeriensis]MDA1365220.1 sugar ABC transporter substrate-binding protein [Glycomyces algeriensis]MDR7349716.1 putative multiple sugar transport system substrate-binding protein [Glycomyces algeriensis]GLI42426.1 sugar ABC transporter substrate-binding protein [Glycomyces algeriensis]